jgi:hypothetical protein
MNNTQTTNIKNIVNEKVRNFKKLRPKSLPLERFEGSGIYALYYKGDNPLYNPTNKSPKSKNSMGTPIYVGRSGQKSSAGGSELYQKIQNQCRSISEARNLEIEDFSIKYVILEGEEKIISEAIEDRLVESLKPTWNKCIEGFANHNPGRGRMKQSPSEWDTLHPGRPWVKGLQGKPKDRRIIRRKVQEYLSQV